MSASLKIKKEYKQWLLDIKSRIKQTQIKAAIKVNTALIELYWELGSQIVEKEEKAKWGDAFRPQNCFPKILKEAFLLLKKLKKNFGID